MLGWIGSLLTGSRSSKIARERLRNTLLHDRAHVTPELMRIIQDEMGETLSKYFDVDRSGTRVQLDRQGSGMALTATFPVRNVRRRRSSSGR